MANKHNSLSHTKWLCKYHIVFTPKYRRKIEYNQYKRDIVNIIQRLCKYIRSRNNRRTYNVRSYTFAIVNTTKIQCIKYNGIFERKKFIDDIRYAFKLEI